MSAGVAPLEAMSRILFVTRQFPYDFDTAVYGIYSRLRMFLDAVSRVADHLDLLFYVNPDADASQRRAEETQRELFDRWGIRASVTLSKMAQNEPGSMVWNHYGAPALGLFRHPDYALTSGAFQVRALEACLQRGPDAVFAHRLPALCPLLKTKKPIPPILLDLDDIEHVKFYRDLSQPPFWPGKRLYWLHLPALFVGEWRAIRRAEKTFVCSRKDRDYLAGVLRLPGVAVVPNAVPIPAQLPQEAGGQKTLLFLGSYTYEPNRAAAQFLATRVWPIIQARVPEARLILAGNKPEKIPCYGSGAAGVEFTGFVADLEDLYRRTTIVCCPVLSGGGTRIKIVEAAAHGKAIVSTRIGAEGLDFQDGREILLRDGAEEFAQACVELLQDPARCRSLGLAARVMAVRIYDRSAVVQGVAEEISSLLARAARSGVPGVRAL